jgi:hypothetical protein
VIDAGQLFVLYIVGVVWLYVLVFRCSYRRSRALGHPNGASFVVAALAMLFWPITLLYWAFGPTPDASPVADQTDP